MKLNTYESIYNPSTIYRFQADMSDFSERSLLKAYSIMCSHLLSAWTFQTKSQFLFTKSKKSGCRIEQSNSQHELLQHWWAFRTSFVLALFLTMSGTISSLIHGLRESAYFLGPKNPSRQRLDSNGSVSYDNISLTSTISNWSVLWMRTHLTEENKRSYTIHLNRKLNKGRNNSAQICQAIFFSC